MTIFCSNDITLSPNPIHIKTQEENLQNVENKKRAYWQARDVCSFL